MEPNKVLDLGGDSLGQRVAQKVSSVGETAGRKVDAAVGYVDKAKNEVAQSFEKMKGVGCEGLSKRSLTMPVESLSPRWPQLRPQEYSWRGSPGEQTTQQLRKEVAVHSND